MRLIILGLVVEDFERLICFSFFIYILNLIRHFYL